MKFLFLPFLLFYTRSSSSTLYIAFPTFYWDICAKDIFRVRNFQRNPCGIYMGYITPPPVAWDVRCIIIIGLEVISHFPNKHNLIHTVNIGYLELLRDRRKKFEIVNVGDSGFLSNSVKFSFKSPSEVYLPVANFFSVHGHKQHQWSKAKNQWSQAFYRFSGDVLVLYRTAVQGIR